MPYERPKQRQKLERFATVVLVAGWIVYVLWITGALTGA